MCTQALRLERLNLKNTPLMDGIGSNHFVEIPWIGVCHIETGQKLVGNIKACQRIGGNEQAQL